MKLLSYYLLLINAVGFLLMLIDKQKARKMRWRIPESTLFAMAFLGGSLGCIGGMYLVRHKTKHPKFTLGLPILLAVQIMLLVIFFLR